MKIVKRAVLEKARKCYQDHRRLVAPLVGFPGCDLTSYSIKIAQQNHGIHYTCIRSLVEILQPDVAFMMMDLSVEANALGLPVRFPLHESSSVERHPIDKLDELDDLRRISVLQDARIQSYIKTVEMMSIGLGDNLLKGAYVIGPFTLAGLLESAERAAMDAILDPKRLEILCEFTTEIIQEYARAMINAGADLICILEPTAVILGPEQFRKFSGYYVHHIIESFKYSNVETIYHICGNTMHLVQEMADTGVVALSLDSAETGVDLAKAARMVSDETVIIGNISPTRVMKDGSVEKVTAATRSLLEQMRPYPNFILSTGCDLPPGTPLDNLKAFMRIGRDFK
jgi:uroporphyrinogen decarboxylase